jgi:competence protein ComEA
MPLENARGGWQIPALPPGPSPSRRDMPDGTDAPEPQTPFEVFIAHATGSRVVDPSSRDPWMVPPASLRGRRVAVGAAVLALVVIGGWLIQSAGGPGGTPLDPELPFAPGVQSTSAEGLPDDVAADPGAEAAASSPAGTDGVMVVHVAGAVAVPGVHTLGPGARVHDAVTAAGGPRSDADLDRLNLAGPLADGARIHVPAVGEAVPPLWEGAPGSTAPTGLGSPSAPGGVSLSQASASELETLPGVGPSTAAAIIAHRTANGPFATVDDLADVRGIGPAKLEAIRGLVVP